jgi:transcriptional regulator of acetoin/glycerol metabolism
VVQGAPAPAGAGGGAVAPGAAALPELDGLSLEEAERWFIERTLARLSGNVNKAAEALGLSRSALYRRLRRDAPTEGSGEPEPEEGADPR